MIYFINYLIENRISENVEKMGALARKRLSELKKNFTATVSDIRGKGLLLIVDFKSESLAGKIKENCLSKGLFLTQTNGTCLRIFPALNINKQELEEGLDIIAETTAAVCA